MKVGEGNSGPYDGSQVDPRSLQRNTAKFENALASYQVARSPEEKARLKAIMDTQLQLINAAVKELKLGGIYKQEAQVESDYNKYIASGSDEDKTALQQDLHTLREFEALLLPPGKPDKPAS
jgi:uncharacterized protein YicC (UPF0701 family)